MPNPANPGHLHHSREDMPDPGYLHHIWSNLPRAVSQHMPGRKILPANSQYRSLSLVEVQILGSIVAVKISNS